MKKVILIRGLPGFGKSTIANQLIANKSGTFAIAADDFPGLYVDGKYQAHLQKDSHAWCKSEFERSLKNEIALVIVHNTFTSKAYMQPYIDLANTYGYSIQIFHTEELLLPGGGRPTSIHNVPLEVIDSMRSAWEPMHPKQEVFSRADIAEAMRFIACSPGQRPFIIFDMDKTVKQTISGKDFPTTPWDAELTPDFLAGMRAMLLLDYFPETYIASNQAGLATGQKTKEFLIEELNFLQELLTNEFVTNPIKSINCSTSKTEYSFLHFSEDVSILTAASPTYKPAIGLGIPAVQFAEEKDKMIWVIGDNDNTDGRFAKNLQSAFPRTKILYIPIEFFPHIAMAHIQNSKLHS